MKLGIDFDNTLVAYDRLFHRVACDDKLIPESTPANKNAVRNALRNQGLEKVWIVLQGRVYGPCMKDAHLFPGVLNALASLHAEGIEICIVSHKTRHPASGESYDLHATARNWVGLSGLCDTDHTGLRPQDIYFELTREEKLARIQQEGCTHFIDDLPEIFSHPAFPEDVQKILFDPSASIELLDVRRVTGWWEITPGFLEGMTVP